MQDKTFFMVGMPESGKSTFIAQLCRLLIFGEKETVLKLEADDLPNGLDYIEDLMKELGAFRVVGRTLDSTLYDIEIPLVDMQGREFNLLIPDLSGEFFRDLVDDRRLKRDVAEKLKEADEILFFINTNTMSSEKRISLHEKSAMKILNEKTESDILSQRNQSISEQDLLSDRKRKKANQSEVVDLLQCVVFFCKGKLKIKIIISAWDKVEKKYTSELPSPEEYIDAELPLLYQYLRANSDQIDYQIWGVSAQGCDFYDEEEVKEKKGIGTFELVKVIDCEKNESYDLTKILFA